MKLTVSFPLAMLLSAMLGGAAMAQVVTEIKLPGTRVFPESITSTTNGTLYVGSPVTETCCVSPRDERLPKNGLSLALVA